MLKNLLPNLRYKLYKLKRAFVITWERMGIYASSFGLVQGFEILYRVRLNRKSGITGFTLPGYLHPVYMRGHSTDYKVFEDVFVEESYRIGKEVKPALIVDAGANVGYVSVYFANKFPEARIIAVEPESGNFRLLQQNASLYGSIEAVQSALWDKVTTFHITNEKAGAWAFRVDETSMGGEMSGDTITMGQILAISPEKFVDILKIDIEGAERQVFASNFDWLDNVGVIIIELHDWLVPGCSNSVLSAIRRKNFSERKLGPLHLFINNDYTQDVAGWFGQEAIFSHGA